MAHAYVPHVVHMVFSTKERRRAIPPNFQSELWAYVAGICDEERMFVHTIGGAEAHVHVLLLMHISTNDSGRKGDRSD
jgi:putative transposase